MMKSLKLFLLCAVAVSAFAPAVAQGRQSRQKSTFWQKHKGKIAKGVALAALIGVTIGAAYHGNKTKQAVEKATLSPGDPMYGDAVAAVGLLGPLGMKRTLNLIADAVNQKVISARTAATIVFSKIGDSLAYYFGVTPAAFKAQALSSGIVKAAQVVREELKQGWSDFSKWATGK